MSTRTQAHDAMLDHVKDTWDGDVTAATIELQWDDVAGDPVVHDSNGHPKSWARVSIREIASPAVAYGGSTIRHDTEGILTVQIFTPFGDGHDLSDYLAQLIVNATRSRRIGDVTMFDPTVTRLGRDRVWFRTDVVVNYRFEEQHSVA